MAPPSKASSLARASATVAAANAQANAAAAAYQAAVVAIDTAGIGILSAGMGGQIAAGGGPNSPLKFQDGITQLTQNMGTASEVPAVVTPATVAVSSAFS